EDGRVELEAIAGAEPLDATVRNELHLFEARIGEACLAAAEAPDLDPAGRIDLLRRAADHLERGSEGLRTPRREGLAVRAADAAIDGFRSDLARIRVRLAEAGAGGG